MRFINIEVPYWRYNSTTLKKVLIGSMERDLHFSCLPLECEVWFKDLISAFTLAHVPGNERHHVVNLVSSLSICVYMCSLLDLWGNAFIVLPKIIFPFLWWFTSLHGLGFLPILAFSHGRFGTFLYLFFSGYHDYFLFYIRGIGSRLIWETWLKCL